MTETPRSGIVATFMDPTGTLIGSGVSFKKSPADGVADSAFQQKDARDKAFAEGILHLMSADAANAILANEAVAFRVLTALVDHGFKITTAPTTD